MEMRSVNLFVERDSKHSVATCLGRMFRHLSLWRHPAYFGTTCPGPRPSAAFGAGAAAALPPTSPTGSLLSWLPDNTTECDVRRWSGSSPEERESAQGLEGLFHSTDEVDDFVARLSAALAGRSQPDEGEPA